MFERIKEHKFMVVIFFAFLLSAIGGYLIFHLIFPSSGSNESPIAAITKEKEPENKTVNFLVLGVDERDGDVGRSDTILVLSTNLATKRIGLISIPRDSRVDIPNHGKEKINHTYAYGGVELTKQVVEKTLNVKIDNYIVFNFRSFKNIIDKMGGIDIYVEKNMYYRDDYDGENGLLIDLKQGEQHLDGEKAMEYVRYRDEEGDIGRVGRQQNFLKAILKKVTSAETIPRLPALVRELFSSVKTDMKFDDFIDYISFLKENQSYEVKSMMVAGTPKMIDDLSYWLIDYDKLKDDLIALNKFIIDEPDNTIMASNDKIEKEKGIFKENDSSGNSLDWEIEKLDEQNKKKNNDKVREKLLQEEREEREEVLARKRYQELAEQSETKTRQQQSSPTENVDGIRIINTTGDSSKTDTAVSALENSGLEVGRISNRQSGQNSNGKTIFIVSSKDTKATDAMKSFPFKFTVIYRNGNEKPTLIIGEDFYK